MRSIRRLTPVLVVLILASGTGFTQTSTLYVTDGDAARLAIVQGGVLQAVQATHVKGYPLTVTGSVWIGDYDGTQPNTIEYDLTGAPTGNTVLYTSIQAVDGATNGIGSWQLGSAFGTLGQVFFSPTLNFQGSTHVFNVPGNDVVGITYDSASGTLWISDRFRILNYSTTGTLLGEFDHSSGRGCIAYEPATDTLWYVTNSSNTITQYSKAGTVLQALTVAGLQSNNWGCEFPMSTLGPPPQLPDPIPALGAWGAALLATLLLGLALVLLRRHRVA